MRPDDRDTVDYPDGDAAESGGGMVAPMQRSEFGRYVILDVLGVGGMGMVCTAYDPKLDRKIALKLLRDGNDTARLTTGRARLVREAQALAKLSHPNIVAVHDVDTHNDQLYIAMEYVEGVDLAGWLEESTREWPEIVDKFVQAARGLAAAHAVGITHRDFKPGNVVVGTDGRARVLDFGLAKSDSAEDLELAPEREAKLGSRPAPSDIMAMISSAEDMKLTGHGRAVGTPAYMSPEQIFGLEVTPVTDQFSFAVSLYEALYGVLPFADDDDPEFLSCVAAGEVRDPPAGTSVPAWLHRIMLQALQPKPSERFASMNELIVALSRDPARRRRRIVYTAAGASLVAFGGFGVWQATASAEHRCLGADLLVQDAWNATRKDNVQRAFAATKMPFAADAFSRVADPLDDFVLDWASVHTEVCEATNVRGDQSAALMDFRMACLGRSRAELSALVEVFEDADAKVVEEAVTVAGSVGAPRRCADVMPTDGDAPPDDPEAVAEVEHALARAAVLLAAGRSVQALEVAQSLDDAVAATAYASTQARHACLSAEALGAEQRYDEATPTYYAAIRYARLADDADQEARAWTQLAHVTGVGMNRPAEGLVMLVPAELAAGTTEAAARALPDVERERGNLLDKSGDLEASIVAQHRALDAYRARDGERSYAVALALHNLGSHLGRGGRLEEASEASAEAIAIYEATIGKHHPATGRAHINLGNVRSSLGDNESAVSAYSEALSILSSASGERHPALIFPLVGLSSALKDTDPARARAAAERALGIASGPGFERARVAVLNNLGGALLMEALRLPETDPERASLLDRALESHRSALEILDRTELGVTPAKLNAIGGACQAGVTRHLAAATAGCLQALVMAREAGDSAREIVFLGFYTVALIEGVPR